MKKLCLLYWFSESGLYCDKLDLSPWRHFWQYWNYSLKVHFLDELWIGYPQNLACVFRRHRTSFSMIQKAVAGLCRSWVVPILKYTDMGWIQICLLFRKVYTYIIISLWKLVKITPQCEGALNFSNKCRTKDFKRFILLIFQIVLEYPLVLWTDIFMFLNNYKKIKNKLYTFCPIHINMSVG